MDLILSIVALAALAMIAGGIYLLRRGQRQQGTLMLVLAAVMVVNVLIWTVPDAGGETPVDRAAAQ